MSPLTTEQAFGSHAGRKKETWNVESPSGKLSSHPLFAYGNFGLSTTHVFPEERKIGAEDVYLSTALFFVRLPF